MKTEHTAVLRAVDSALYRQSELCRHGPLLLITHRLWVPGAACMPGEEVFSIDLDIHGTEMHLPFSRQLRLMVDYLARQRYGQSASQLAAGMNSDPFCRYHAANARGKVDLRCSASRTATKQQVFRIRKLMGRVFIERRITLSPDRILASEPSDTNEMHYRLVVRPVWRHI